VSGNAKLLYIGWEGALYRGFSRSWPTEVWSPREHRFVPYTGAVPKPIEWGDEISETEAINFMMDTQSGAASASPRRRPSRRG